MSEFDAVIDAQIRGSTVVMAFLMEVSFASGEYRLWTGIGTRSFGDRDWLGIGAIAEISDISRLQNGEADPFEVSLAGNDDIVRMALIEFDEEARDRSLSVYMQFLEIQDETALGPPWLLRDGIMRGATLTVDEDSMVLKVTCDTINSRRNKPPYGRLTDRDQQARYPGDLGLEFVHTLNGSEITWPDF